MALHFIVNPAAKNGMSIKTWRKLEKELTKQNIDYYVYFTKSAGDGIKIVRNILEEFDDEQVIVAVGGDGTVHEIVNGVYPYRHGIISCIPAGSGNDFSRGLKIPKNPKKAVERFVRMQKFKKKMMDCGYFFGEKVKAGLFINNFGCGFDARVAKKVNESFIKPILNRFSLGKLTYVIYLIKELFLYKPAKIMLVIDGVEKGVR